MTITEFLLERIAEDEAVAQAALSDHRWAVGIRRAGSPGAWRSIEAYCVLTEESPLFPGSSVTVADSVTEADAEHITRHDPARVLAECEAKRRIIELHDHVKQTYTDTPGVEFGCTICHIGANGEDFNGGWCDTVRALALPYDSHPDYDEAWRP